MPRKNKKKSKNKILLICFLIAIFLLVSLFFLKNFNPRRPNNLNNSVTTQKYQPRITGAWELPEPTQTPNPTRVPTPISVTPKSPSKTFQVGTRTLIIKYDSKILETSLFFLENNQEILINKWGATANHDDIYIRIPLNFKISLDNNYLYYVVPFYIEGSMSEFYSFVDKKLKLNVGGGYNGFTKDNKYFYRCSNPIYGPGGVVIYELPQIEIVYKEPISESDIANINNMECNYNEQSNSLAISYETRSVTYKELEMGTAPPVKKIIYYFDTNKAIRQ